MLACRDGSNTGAHQRVNTQMVKAMQLAGMLHTAALRLLSGVISVFLQNLEVGGQGLHLVLLHAESSQSTSHH